SGTEVESGNLPGGTGWYRKMFTMPAEFDGKEVILNFDGAYNNAYVYVNGQLVCENHYGYNSFSVNISDYIVCNGTTWNIVAVKVVSEMASSRWYPGSGLTRDVTMTIVNPVHVSLYGTKVTTTNNTTMN
ncbi:beta-galactosidase, partial [Salmonella enterica subsp. enterica serovar Cerro]